jgi:hypothetical protein
VSFYIIFEKTVYGALSDSPRREFRYPRFFRSASPMARIQLLLTPLGVLLEKLIVTKLIKKLRAYYGTRRFITMFTRATWATWIQSTYPHPISLRFILILISHLHIRLQRSLPFDAEVDIIFSLTEGREVLFCYLVQCRCSGGWEPLTSTSSPESLTNQRCW